MNATILSLSREVREAALDLRALQRKIKDSGALGYEWMPAEANARQRMIVMSLEQGGVREKSADQANPPPRAGEGFLKLAQNRLG